MVEIIFASILLFGAACTGRFVLTRIGCGFDNRIEEFSFSCAIGFGALVLAIFAVGSFHLLFIESVYVVVFGWIALGIKSSPSWLSAFRYYVPRLLAEYRSVHFWVTILAVAGLTLSLIRALAPPHGATDPLAYQLALPKIYLAKHFLSFEPTITGALYPSNMGLLYLVGIALKNGSLAQILHWLTGVLSCLAIVGACQRFFSWRVGIWAATIFSFVPVVVVFGPQGYIDVGLCYFQLMAIGALLIWTQAPNPRILILAALLCGLAMGVKPQGYGTVFLGSAIILIARLARRDSLYRLLKDVGLYCAAALVMVIPWFVRSYYWSGNPIWPLANDFFDSHAFALSPQVGSNLTTGSTVDNVVQGIIPSLAWFDYYWHAMSPWAWTFSPGGWQKAIGVYFAALLPGALLVTRTKKHWILIAICLTYYVLLVRFLHMNPRYGLVLFAFLAVLCGLVAEYLSSATKSRPLSTLFNAGFLVTGVLNLCFAYQLSAPVHNVVFGKESVDSFLISHEASYRVFQFANQNLPPSATVLLQGEVKGYYCDGSYLWDHPDQGVLRYERFDTADELRAGMKELGITHVIRIINLPPVRRTMYPNYFTDPYHETFRKRFLQLMYHDEAYALFRVNYC